MSIIQKNYLRLALPCMTALSMSISTMVSAKDYQVEVLIFENNNPSVATENHGYVAPKRMKSGSTVWLVSPSLLIEEAQTLESSPNYELMHHYSWGVESLAYENSANYAVAEQEALGFIKVYADQLLFTNIDLDYKGFRMKEKRRLKLNEKHFFDHPKFGLLMQVSRLEASEEGPDDSELGLESSR